MFDGEGFKIWQYHMEIIFEAKEILKIIDGTLPRPLHVATVVLTVEQKRELSTWDLGNVKGRTFIS